MTPDAGQTPHSNLFEQLSSAASAQAGAFGRRTLAQVLLHGATALSAIAAIVFALLAAHTALAISYGSIAASLILCAAMALVALILFVIGKILKARRRRPSMAGTLAVAALPLAGRLLAPALMKSAALAGGVALLAALLSRGRDEA